MGNREVVSSLYAAFAARDVAAVLALTDPGLVVTQTELLPWGGAYHGPAGLQEFLGKLLGRVDSRVEVEEYVEAGDRVVAIGRTRGSVRGSGAPFDVRVAHLWTIRAGKAARFEAYIDTPAMLRSLGG
jgi:uncharacterized protein